MKTYATCFTTPMRSLLLAMTMLATCQIAFAQFVWTDDKGVKQYSDRPPPSSVPRSHILKSPGNAAPVNATEQAAASATDNSTAASSAASTKKAVPMTTAERNADYTKRKMEEAEKAKKSADAVKIAADKKANCDRAQSYSRSLEDGVRVTSTDKNGERSYLSDEQRAQEIRNAQRVIAECK